MRASAGASPSSFHLEDTERDILETQCDFFQKKKSGKGKKSQALSFSSILLKCFPLIPLLFEALVLDGGC